VAVFEPEARKLLSRIDPTTETEMIRMGDSPATNVGLAARPTDGIVPYGHNDNDRPVSVPLHFNAYPIRFCANLACGKRLAMLNKKQLCFGCNDRMSPKR